MLYVLQDALCQAYSDRVGRMTLAPRQLFEWSLMCLEGYRFNTPFEGRSTFSDKWKEAVFPTPSSMDGITFTPRSFTSTISGIRYTLYYEPSAKNLNLGHAFFWAFFASAPGQREAG